MTRLMAATFETVLRVLLRLYPARFRSQFGKELIETSRRDLDEADKLGLLPLVKTFIQAVVDAGTGLLPEHLAARRRRRQESIKISAGSLREDLRYALRLIGRRRGFAFTAILLIALGTGVNTVIFSLVRAVLLKPLPYFAPDRLVFLWNDGARRPPQHNRHGIFTGSEGLEIRRRNTTLDGIAAIQSWQTDTTSQMDLVGPEGAERLRGAFVTADFFRVLGVQAALGRTFADDDNDSNPVVVLSDGFWKRRFGSNLSIVGQSILLMTGRADRAFRRFTIVGILQPGFRFTYPEETEIWALKTWSAIAPIQALQYQLIGRLEKGRAVADAQADATTIAKDLVAASSSPLYAQRLNQTLVVAELISDHVEGEVRAGLWLLAGVAAMVLMIACVNLALLTLAHTIDRAPEMALRAALGAAPWRLVRQLAAEGVVLSLIGSGLGVLTAFALQPMLRSIVPPLVPRGAETRVDAQVLLFALGVCAITALVCGLVPGLQCLRTDLKTSLRAGGAAVTRDAAVIRSRSMVIGIQAAIVVLLLVGAGLLLHSFWKLQRVDLGFQGDGVFTIEMRLINPKYRKPELVLQFQQELIARVRSIPGVLEAGLTSAVPMRGVDFTYVIGAPGERGVPANLRSVDAAYFSVMRIPLRAGRLFTNEDSISSPQVVIVSESYAHAVFGDASPIGRVLEFTKPATIVGVVADVRYKEIRQAPGRALYRPRSQNPMELICLVARTAPGTDWVSASIRDIVRELDPEQPVQMPTTIDRILAAATAEQKFYTTSTSIFAGLAVLLAIAGIFGVAARTVGERKREIAIRMALGADAHIVTWSIVAHGFVPVVLGGLAGLAGSAAVSRLLVGFLFEVKPADPATLAGSVLVVTLMALAGNYWPARRAARTDPMTALKSE